MSDYKDNQPPLLAGDVCTGYISSVGEKGDGILRVKGFVVFVPGVESGDFVKVKITKVLAKVSFAQLLEKKKGKPKPAGVNLPRFKKKEEVDPEIKELLTTKGDSDEFGDDADDDDF
ncbi:MAG: TRAM domain-containing protein [Candidatus Nanoarchaeia archaeon]